MANWLVMGPDQNWKIALELGVWGLPASYRTLWEALALRDGIILYAMAPVRGVIGYGVVTGKKIETRPIWPEEQEVESALWPLRLYFEIQICLLPQNWETMSVQIQRKIPLRRACQHLKDEYAGELLMALKKAVKIASNSCRQP